MIRRPLDEKAGFSKYLEETEGYIRSGDWEKAKLSLGDSVSTWKKIKPILQVDVDHDYINDIERNFTLLKACLETGEKPSSLSLILLIQHEWDTIGEM